MVTTEGHHWGAAPLTPSCSGGWSGDQVHTPSEWLTLH